MEAAPQRTISDIPINICIWASLLLLLLRSEKKRIKQPDERKQKEEAAGAAAVASPCWMIKIRCHGNYLASLVQILSSH